MITLDRRRFLAVLASGPLMSPTSGGSAAADSLLALRQMAYAGNLFYGTAVRSDNLRNDKVFAEVVAREAGVLVSETETKRMVLEPKPGFLDFRGTDAILDFAHANSQLMRGHVLVWYQANPAWLELALIDKPDERLLTDYILKVVGRYRGKFHSWDVVNEAINPDDGEKNGLRTNSIWYKAFGEYYIETAFWAARQADPTALLVYNETNLEGDSRVFEQRRRATIALLERLIAKKVPIDAFGLQGHLKAYKANYSEKTISRFLDEIASLGLKIMITEFDVADINGPSDIARRDQEVADLTTMFLTVAFSKPSMLGCLTWGISDKYSWLSITSAYMWKDGERSRGLPYDASFVAKPMREAMASAFRDRHLHERH